MNRTKIAVIGLGNYLLADEGAGLHVVALLEEKFGDNEVDIIAEGTPGMNLLHQFDGREKIIFIDAGNCGLQPGEFKRFRPDEVQSKKELNGYSLHEFDLISFLHFAKNFPGVNSVEVVIYCIQPHEIKMSDEISPILKESLPLLVQAVYHEVAEDLRGASIERQIDKAGEGSAIIPGAAGAGERETIKFPIV
jgi:hydrogenase maturation protease